MAHYCLQNEVLAVPCWHPRAPEVWLPGPVRPLPTLCFLSPLLLSFVYSAHALHTPPCLCSDHAFVPSARSIFRAAPSRSVHSSRSSRSHRSLASSRKPSHTLQAAGTLPLLHFHALACLLRSARQRQVFFQFLVHVSDSTARRWVLEVQPAPCSFSYSAWNLGKCTAYSRRIEWNGCLFLNWNCWLHTFISSLAFLKILTEGCAFTDS